MIVTDPISVVSGGVGIAQGLMQFLGYLRGIAGSNIISAHFNWDGTRNEGSDKIEVEKHPSKEGDGIWWFSVKEQADYVFIRMPVIESCAHELVGLVAGENNPDARYWRWVAQERQGVIVGGQNQPANLKVDFIVIGYRPKALIKHFSGTG
jgi:hypothetical protein